MSITTIEKLSNEFFYDIFEYLDGYEIFQSFSNLNHHFEQLINSLSISFKFNLHSLIPNATYTNGYKQFLLNHKHQIISFHLPKNDFFLSFSIDSSFHRLQSLVIDQIPSHILLSILANLSSLSYLASLTMNIQYSFRDLTEFYRLIFILPKLKYIKCSANEDCTCISLPIAHKGQFSPIKHLVINHECSMDTLCTLISYTPQLSHLSLNDLSESDESDNVPPVTLSNLTSLSIEKCNITFDDLETFIKKIKCNLKFLRVINDCEGDDYLNSDRWEELIVNYLPKLENFYLKCSQDAVDPESDSLSNFEPTAQFNSLFWNERKWVLEIEMISSEYVYSVCSYKERWYNVDHSNKISNSTRLNFTILPRDDDYDDYKDYIMVLNSVIHDILAVAQIYHLEISEKNISSNILIRIIQKFSALKTLKISSLELSELFIKDKNRLSIAKKNKITKVYLEQMSTIEEVYFLLKLCPRMEYLKVGFMHNMNIELFIKDILKKIKDECNQHLRSICLHIPTAMIEKLKQMINHEKLLSNFKIEYVLGNIYLQWE